MGTQKLLRQILPKNFWGDKLYGRYRFYKKLGRFPEKWPVRFNDHLFALKTSGACYDPLIQFLTDKEHAKQYIAAITGKDYLIETYRILRNREEIRNFFPDRFPCVFKPTHSSGEVLFCVDSSSPLDRRKLANWFNINRYERSRQQNYRYLRPKIIVEEFFSKDGLTVPKDYKFFCFEGIPKIVQVDAGRFSNQYQSFYDSTWARIPVVALYPGGDLDEEKPALFNHMLNLARQLSAPFPFVRVDMYATATEIRIGEMTFIPWGGTLPLQPPNAEFEWGALFGNSDAQPQT